MLKLAAGLVSGVIGFLIAFSFVTRDEIAGEVAVKLETGFVEQCVAHLQGSIPNPDRTGDVCKCMKADFAAHGYTLTDTFGSDYPQMAKITRSCAALYSSASAGPALTSDCPEPVEGPAPRHPGLDPGSLAPRPTTVILNSVGFAALTGQDPFRPTRNLAITARWMLK